ncbi:hypothetical protein V1292_006038 [Bradyrhizobium sp. AZCC 1719]
MTWKKFVIPLAIAPRRRAVATALIYGLSLAVRFTSAAGEETEVPAPAARSANPMASFMINDGAQLLHRNWPPKPVLPIGLNRGWPLGPRSCHAACESRVPISAMPSCPP